ncbi:hypothetical protein BH10PSE7_BH10PSE7_33260 [soil metagenome]
MGLQSIVQVSVGGLGFTPVIGILADGDLVIASNDYFGIFQARIYAPDGTAIGDPLQLTSSTGANLSNAKVGGLPNGHLLLYWGSTGREFNLDGTPVGDDMPLLVEPQKNTTLLPDGRIIGLVKGNIHITLADGTPAAPDLLVPHFGPGHLGVSGRDFLILEDGSIAVVSALSTKIEPAGIGALQIFNPRGLTADGDSPSLWHGGDLSDTITAGNGNDSIYGHEGDDVLSGAGGNDELLGGAGNDTLSGGHGNDLYLDPAADDHIEELNNGGTDTILISRDYQLDENNIDNLTLFGPTAVNGTGNSLNNVIIGNDLANSLNGGEGNDTLNGGIGADTLIGSAGDDTYIYTIGEDSIAEGAGQGTDTLVSLATIVLPENFENVVLAGSSAIDGTGNSENNVITGNAAANRIDGAAGNDTMIGGGDDDTYIVNSGQDQISEHAGGGYDRVYSNVTFGLSANIEYLALTGSGDSKAYGNARANTLVGNSGDNTLNGVGGADTMRAGAGNDVYVVDSPFDVVAEQVNGGTDRVISTINLTLVENVENLILAGTAVTGTGNGLANRITGNSENNTLDGLGDSDTMAGGAGDDLYYAGNSGIDSIIEGVNGGEDTVFAYRDITLAQNVEDAVLKMGARLTGNASDNDLTGNGGDNRLSGGLSADTMHAGTGSDTYIVDNSLDRVVEKKAEGSDGVLAGTDYALSANVENLTLTGSAHTGSGNGLSNKIAGTSLANRLSGAGGDDALRGYAGDDTLAGGTGNDTLSGGTGHDTFVFNTAPNGITNSDRVSDFSAANDVIALENSIFTHAGPAGVLAAFRFYAGTGAHDLNDRIIYDPASGALLYDADGSGGEGAFRLATLNTHLSLTQLDFLIT